MAIREARRRIAQMSSRCSVVTVSHYHFDHHTPSFEDWWTMWTELNETAKQIYEGKTLLIKNPRQCINPSQRRRGWAFQISGGTHANRIEVADGRTFSYGDTEIKFSQPVFHGSEGSDLGWVLMVTITTSNEQFTFAPDIQGPMSVLTLGKLLAEKSQMIMLGGPPLYLAGFKVDERELSLGIRNMRKVVEKVPVTIVEHHLLRDANWREKISEVTESARELGHTVMTSAEYLGHENSFLEANRKLLFEKEPPSKEFQKWMKFDEERKKHIKPPI